jgi:hypothetical protein
MQTCLPLYFETFDSKTCQHYIQKFCFPSQSADRLPTVNVSRFVLFRDPVVVYCDSQVATYKKVWTKYRARMLNIIFRVEHTEL